MDGARSRKILIVDDAPPVRMMLKTFLGKIGLREELIDSAEDGEKGLESFERTPPDLVFMDIEMPRMGGEETATQMLAKRPDLKVVVMTGVDESDSRVKQLRSWGAFAVLSKPLRLEKVRALMELIDEEETDRIRIR